MNDLCIYVLFNSISVCEDDGMVKMKGLCNGIFLRLERFLPQAGLKPKTSRSVGQC